MDVFSHGLWAGAVAKVANKEKPKLLNVSWTVVFGVLPDVLSFAPVFIFLFYNLLLGRTGLSTMPRPEEAEPAARDTLPIFQLTSTLYNLSHSLIIFFLVFGLVFLIMRRPVFELGGWLFHILIDIPTHSYRFYPTPFLWPVSGFKFNGLSWANPWFLLLNYSAIILVYFLLRKRKNNN